MRKFTAVEVKAIIEADRAGKIHLEPRDYTDETLAAALRQYRALPMVGTEAHPGYHHAWGKNDLCIYKGCKAGPAELEAEYQAARDRQDCETPAGMEAERVAARAMIAEMEQPTGHPYKASTTGPLCEVCGERKINRYGTHGLPGLEQGDQQAPAEKPIVYLSCQYCNEPAGDRQTKEQGICHDCKQKMVDEGHAWREDEENKSAHQRRADRANLRARLAATA